MLVVHVSRNRMFKLFCILLLCSFLLLPQAAAAFSPIVSQHLILMPDFPGGSEVKKTLAESGDVV